MIAEIQRAAPMRQPAHDDLVRCDHLLAVDAEILARLVRPACDDQSPGDKRRDIAGPAVLDRQFAQVHLVALPHHLLTRRAGQHFGRHGEHLLQHRPFFPRILQAFGRLRFFQVGKQFAHVAQCGGGFFAHAQRHAVRRSEQVGEYRHVVPDHILEQQRRPLRAQHAVTDFRHLQMRGNRCADALEFADLLQLCDEVAQVLVFHECSLWKQLVDVRRKT